MKDYYYKLTIAQRINECMKFMQVLTELREGVPNFNRTQEAALLGLLDALDEMVRADADVLSLEGE